ncbi:MAG: hypothetical protein QM811_15390 [Pirellulales bacterium]
MPTFDNSANTVEFPPAVPTGVMPNEPSSANFVERRSRRETDIGTERRQFCNSYEGLSPEAAVLGEAVDRYKMRNRRRFITYEEILTVIRELGYAKQA